MKAMSEVCGGCYKESGNIRDLCYYFRTQVKYLHNYHSRIHKDLNEKGVDFLGTSYHL